MTRYSLLPIIALMIIFSSIMANAQKLPNVQQASLRAPENVKVDGKPTEWGDKLQAYNKATDVFYTIANDDNNLYLVIQATDPSIINKLVNGRVTFTINKSGKKNDNDAIAISYPVFEKNNKPGLHLTGNPKIVEGSPASIKLADSFMYANNKRMTDRIKSIKVTGVKTLDTLVSIYNEDGIKAAALFDNKLVYTCELAVSLKLAGLSVNDPVKFTYNVMLNPVIMDDIPGFTIVRNAQGTITSLDINNKLIPPNARELTAATDFWGEYMLAKK